MLSKTFSFHEKQLRMLLRILVLVVLFAFPAVSPFGQAQAPTEAKVFLRASNGQYVVAEGGGGGVVNANRSQAGAWETFTLIDKNGGPLVNGDPVNLRSANGPFVVAEGGGGREVLANRTVAGAWETFVILKVRGSSGTEIRHGDSVALKASNGQYVVAEGGGGGAVNANRNAIGAWETFTLGFAAGSQPTTGSAVPPPGGLTVAQPGMVGPTVGVSKPLTGLRPKPPAVAQEPPLTPPPATSAPSPQPREYAIRLRANNCKFVRVQQTNIMGAVSDMRGPAETLTLVDKNGGDIESGDVVYLKTSDGRFVRASIMQYGGEAMISAGSFRGGSEETFQIYNTRGGPIRHLSSVTLTTTVPGMALYVATRGSDCQGPDLYAKSQSPSLCAEFIFEAATASWMPQRTAYGPYSVPGNSLLNTGLNVPRCSLVEVQASGTVVFSPVGPVHGPDGENAYPPAGTAAKWPALLHKYSLICRVGGDWNQCGTNASFTAQYDAPLILQANDDLLWDNLGSWQVSVWITPPR